MTIEYTRTVWANNESGGTAITAARLNNIEQGIVDTVDEANRNFKLYYEDAVLQDVVAYNGSSAAFPRFRRFGRVCSFTGEVSPLNEFVFTSNNFLQVCKIPEQYMPIQLTTVLCQATGESIFYTRFTSDGNVLIGRYRDKNGYKTASTTTWFPIHAVWLTNKGFAPSI